MSEPVTVTVESIVADGSIAVSADGRSTTTQAGRLLIGMGSPGLSLSMRIDRTQLTAPITPGDQFVVTVERA